MSDKQENLADGSQNGAGEQIRLREDEENKNLDNLRGGADPQAGNSEEVPRDNKSENLDAPDGEEEADKSA